MDSAENFLSAGMNHTVHTAESRFAGKDSHLYLVHLKVNTPGAFEKLT
jgi:hypothetical protein